MIDHAFVEAASHTAGDKPTVIIAKTIKGKGFSEVEDSPDWHGKPFPPDMADAGDRRARRRPQPDRPRAAAGAGTSPGPVAGAPEHASRTQGDENAAEQGLAGVQGGRQGRHPQGLRRRARRPRRAGRQGRRARRRGQQLDLCLGVRDTRSPSGTSRCSSPSSRWSPPPPGSPSAATRLRVDVRGVPHPGLRLHPDGRHLRRRTCGWSARTRASRSAPTARRRWRWRTSR